jgi:predicted dehydrogenase
MKKISWGIIGCGNVTEVKSGPAFNKVPNSELVAVMRRNEEKAKDYAKRHGVGKWYANANELINDNDVNAIYIATPPAYHEEFALMAIAAGKPVYIEKPMALNAASAQRIANAAMESKTKVCIAHYRRQQPLFKEIKSLLDRGIIGKVQTAQLEFILPHNASMVAETEEPWRLNPAISGGGLFHDLAPHQLDLMYYFFGKPKKVNGIAVNTAALYSAADTVSGQVFFENNILFNGFWSFASASIQKKDHCIIIGTKGTISFSIFEQAPLRVITVEEEQNFYFDALPHVQQPMIESVVQYFLGETSNPCSAEDGVIVMRLIDALTTIKNDCLNPISSTQ